MKTFSPRPADIKRNWHVIDASDEVLGRMAAQVARLLMGKHKPIYATHLDTGDFVVVINAAKVRFTGNHKATQKLYYRHSGYPGGIKKISLRDQLQKHPERVIKAAVRGMLPKNRYGRALLGHLKVYAGGEHPHQAQTPKPFEG